MCVSIENKKGQFTSKSITNTELREYANEIAGVVAVGRKARVQLCGILAEMAQKDIFDQFESFGGFCEERLGLKKTQAYDMVRVGHIFGITRTNDWRPQLTANGGEWTQTQLMALLPMGAKQKGKKAPKAEEVLASCNGLVKRGLIKPSMTVADIKKVVAAERPDAKQIEDKKVKRETKKLEEKRQQEAAEKDIYGKQVANIGIWQLGDGTIRVTFDGVEQEYGLENLQNIVHYLASARNYTYKGKTTKVQVK